MFCLFVLFVCLSASFATNEPLNWADVTATRLVSCFYDDSNGKWKNELAWQSGNTLESLANFISIVDSPLKYIFHETFVKTDMYVGGDCFDDWQWWLLAWLQAYSVDSNLDYLHRAAQAYEVVVTKAWNPSICNGGIQWCPKNAYKNAITNELFLVASMRLHPYATLVGKPANYYLDWAIKEWQWFEQSGMINKQFLINDGLNSPSCENNQQTTWTYNQGVILSGLGLLANATGNSSLLAIAQNIADATIQYLTYSGQFLREPCEPNCDNDQKLFKGIFIRHLSYLLRYLTDSIHIEKYRKFIEANAQSLWSNNRCVTDGTFGITWNNQTSTQCDANRDTSSTSSAFDLFISAAQVQSTTSTRWILLGQGNCADDNNDSMPNFFSGKVNENVCRQTAEGDQGSAAYDFELKCNGETFCRIRTLSDQSKTPAGFQYGGGNARTVTQTNKEGLTNCFLKTE